MTHRRGTQVYRHIGLQAYAETLGLSHQYILHDLEEVFCLRGDEGKNGRKIRKDDRARVTKIFRAGEITRKAS